MGYTFHKYKSRFCKRVVSQRNRRLLQVDVRIVIENVISTVVEELSIEKEKVCSECKKVFNTVENIQSHIIYQHNGLARINDDRPMTKKETEDALKCVLRMKSFLPCQKKDCGKKYKTYATYARHVALCGKEYIRKRKLKCEERKNAEEIKMASTPFGTHPRASACQKHTSFEERKKTEEIKMTSTPFGTHPRVDACAVWCDNFHEKGVKGFGTNIYGEDRTHVVKNWVHGVQQSPSSGFSNKQSQTMGKRHGEVLKQGLSNPPWKGESPRFTYSRKTAQNTTRGVQPASMNATKVQPETLHWNVEHNVLYKYLQGEDASSVTTEEFLLPDNDFLEEPLNSRHLNASMDTATTAIKQEIFEKDDLEPNPVSIAVIIKQEVLDDDCEPIT